MYSLQGRPGQFLPTSASNTLFPGVLAGILHNIPYVGTPIATGIVGLVALVQFSEPYQAGYLMLAVISIAILLGVVLTSFGL
jgi:predicted PurR-regulated permease PerM